MPDGAWAMSLLPTGLILFLGLLWWFDKLIKRSQENEAREERRKYQVKVGTGKAAMPPARLKLNTGEPPVPQKNTK